MATSNLVVSGGPLHDFAASTAALVEVLSAEDVRSTVVDDPRAAIAALAVDPSAYDLVTINALWWQMPAERHAPLRTEWAFTLRDDEARTLHDFVNDGGALLACHSATICFDGHPLWADCIGATWDWSRSCHPPLAPVVVTPTDAGRAHPVTSGIEAFTTTDEIYGFLDQSRGLEPLLTSAHGGTDHPVLWARAVGHGRVVTDLLGHDAGAMADPLHRTILQRAARWLIDGTANGRRRERSEPV